MMHVEVMQRRIDWAAGWLLRAQRQRIFGVAAKTACLVRLAYLL